MLSISHKQRLLFLAISLVLFAIIATTPSSSEAAGCKQVRFKTYGNSLMIFYPREGRVGSVTINGKAARASSTSSKNGERRAIYRNPNPSQYKNKLKYSAYVYQPSCSRVKYSGTLAFDWSGFG